MQTIEEHGSMLAEHERFLTLLAPFIAFFFWFDLQAICLWPKVPTIENNKENAIHETVLVANRPS
jgi:hypothetical protein